MEYLHGVFEGIELGRDSEAVGEEEGMERGKGAMMDEAALREEKNGVDSGREDLEARLVDGKDDGAAPGGGDICKGLHDVEGGRAVETGGGFVEEDHSWIMQEAETNGDSPALAPRESVSEQDVGEMGEAEVGEEGGDDGGDVCGGREEEARCKGEGLEDGEKWKGGVVLGDVCGQLAEGGGLDRGAIEEE